MIRRWVLLFTLVAPPALAQYPISDVLASSHSFTAGNPGPITSSDTRPCVFCHISHSGLTTDGYLWNQRTSTRPYTAYQSPSMNASAANPAAGASKLCLSCHDGTVAVGDSVAMGQIPVSGSMDPSDITGTNLGGHHPLGFQPVDDGQLYAGLALAPPVSADPAVRLPRGIIECISCHDPHVEGIDAARRRFLVRSNTNGGLCLACHDPSRPAPSNLNGWTSGSHANATNTRNEFYNSVAANACNSCHLPHNALASPPLLRAGEEDVCSGCHAGSGTAPTLLSVMSQFNKVYSHPITQSGLHSSTENAFPLNANRHAECPDCHNSHAARAWTATTSPPAVSPPLTGASGVDASGQAARRPAVNEHDICFKCHAGSSNKPQGPGYTRYGDTASRQTDALNGTAFNTQVEFNSSVARHNVVLPRRLTNAQIPSLRANMLSLGGAATGRTLAVGTYIYCGDCHQADDARGVGGTSASGAHGSVWPHILERRYVTEPPPTTPGGSAPGITYQSGVAGTAALCNKCHDVDGSVLQDASFQDHNKHVSGEGAPCATCHDPHGISGGSLTNNARLVNFDTRIVGPSSSGFLRFESTGAFAGRCYLTCHGKNHNPISY